MRKYRSKTAHFRFFAPEPIFLSNVWACSASTLRNRPYLLRFLAREPGEDVDVLVSESGTKAARVRGFDEKAMALLLRARTSTRRLDRRETLIPHGPAGGSLVLIQRGWAGRIRHEAGDRRQILDLLLPGDLCGLEAVIAGHALCTVEALTDVEAVRFDAASLISLMQSHPELTIALLDHAVHQTANARANQARMFKRSATERLTDLIHALVQRLRQMDASVLEPEIPLTQFDLADATGLTAIHVNRALKSLRAEGRITIGRGRMRVTDLALVQGITE